MAVTCSVTWREARSLSSFRYKLNEENSKSTVTSPCWSDSAFRETRALTAGNVMLDMAATVPAAHIILQWQERLQSGGRPALRSVQYTVWQNFLLLGCIYFSLFKKKWNFFFKTWNVLHHTVNSDYFTAGKISLLYVPSLKICSSSLFAHYHL